MATPPSFTIIIPTFGRPQQLPDCLESLTRLHPPRNGFEVVVVDDGSPEPLDETIHRWTGELDLRLLRQENQGPGRARNLGAAHARGRFLAFTDDDCHPAPEWLTSLEDEFQRRPRAFLGGRTENRPDTVYAVANQVIHDAVYRFFNPRAEESRFLASNNIALPASLFHEVGGFDPGFYRSAAEDRELCDRCLFLGHRLVYVARALVLHCRKESLRSFLTQHFSYGQGAHHYQKIRAQRGSGQLSDDFGFYRRLPATLWSNLRRLRLSQILPVAALLAAWQITNTAGFFYAKMFNQQDRMTE